MATMTPEDRQACMDVLLRYTKGVDQRDMDLYRSCFADDVEVVGFGEEVFHGGDAWTAYVVEALKPFGPTQHMLGPQLAEMEGDIAHTRTDVQAHHYMADDPTKTLTLWATYNSDMKKIDGTWKIVRHELESRGSRLWGD